MATGRVQWAKAGTYSLVSTRTANIRVYWSGGILPPEVFVGNKVSFIGRLVTYNEGKIFKISDAVPFKAKFWYVMEPVVNHLWHYLEDPRTWQPEENLDRLKIEDYKEPAAP